MITTPLLGDGNWRGGWWARYDRYTGEMIWRRWHRRGASLFALIGEVLIATTHKGSGVYGISYATGKKLWSRLGDRFDLLFKLCEFLPCDNEGDGPSDIVDDQVFTDRGRMLDPITGRIKFRHRVEHQWNPETTLTTLVDGNPWQASGTWPKRSGGTEVPVREVEHFLAGDGLVASREHAISVRKHGAHVYVIACVAQAGPPNELIRPVDVPHFFLIVLRATDNTVVHREPLGKYFLSHFAWLDSTTLAITVRTKRQWHWGYRRDLRVYDLTGMAAGFQ